MKIRPYHISDLEAVADLFTASVHSLGRDHYEPAQLAAWAPQPPVLCHWRKRLEAARTLVAEADGQLAGFLAYTPRGHIDLLYTAPAYARRGVASMLYHRAASSLASAGASELSTEASLVARPFFERQGFLVTQEQCVVRRGVSIRRFAMRKSL